MKKVLSREERLAKLQEKFEKPVFKYAGLKEKVSVESYDVDAEGRMIKKVELKTCEVKDRNEGLTIHDFSIGNLQAIGAVNQLKFSQLQGDVDTSSANIEKTLDFVESEEINNAASVAWCCG